MGTSENLDEEDTLPDTWFVPHFAPRSNRPLETAICRAWKEYASYYDHYHLGWASRLEMMMHGIPRVWNERGSRMAATFMLWSVTNNGRGFLHTFYRDQSEAGHLGKEDAAIQSWAKENRLLGVTNNSLACLLFNEQGKPVYTNPPYPTLEDNRIVEMLCIFFSTEEGRKFLYETYKKDGNLHFLPSTF